MRTKGDVFNAIYPPEKALVMKMRADLYQAILKAAKGYTPGELQIILQEPQPRISELLNGKLGGKSLEKLLTYADRLGIEHRGFFPQANKNIPKRELELAWT
jgi:predicted XRE-type DNA-binding protein